MYHVHSHALILLLAQETSECTLHTQGIPWALALNALYKRPPKLALECCVSTLPCVTVLYLSKDGL